MTSEPGSRLELPTGRSLHRVANRLFRQLPTADNLRSTDDGQLLNGHGLTSGRLINRLLAARI